MRVGMAEAEGRRFVAALTPQGALDVARAAVGHYLEEVRSLEGLLRLGPDALAVVGRLVGHPPSQALVEAGRVRWRAPLSGSGKICGIGLNYRDHCREQGLEPPKSPILFAKYGPSLIGPGDEVRWSPALTRQVDWEAELGVVIGRPARRVPVARALEHVAGYLPANDVTARDLQKSDGQFVRAKSLETFCPVGPQLVTRDEIPDPHGLAIRCRVNGGLKQDSNTSNLLFRVDRLVSFLSQAFTLEPGDLILTGTPPGVGMHRKPPEFLNDGDTVEVEIEGLGVLRNPCRTEDAPSEAPHNG